MLLEESSDYKKDYKNLLKGKNKMIKKLKIGNKDKFKEFFSQIGQIRIIWLFLFMELLKKDKKVLFILPIRQLKPLLIIQFLNKNLLRFSKIMQNISPAKQVKNLFL